MLRIITYQSLAESLGRAAACLATQAQDRAQGLVTSIAKPFIDAQNANREALRQGGLGAS